ncbi:MAG: hypothetical protein KDC95_14865 [Planctomycetes bacterium]|nr:hypothetical protein [Planctomycetota bacterium]
MTICILVAGSCSCASRPSIVPKNRIDVERVARVIEDLFDKAQRDIEAYAAEYCAATGRAAVLLLPLDNRSRATLDSTNTALLEGRVEGALVNMRFEHEEGMSGKVCELTEIRRVRAIMQKAGIGLAPEKLFLPDARTRFLEAARGGGLDPDLFAYCRFLDPSSQEAGSRILQIELKIVRMVDGRILVSHFGNTQGGA